MKKLQGSEKQVAWAEDLRSAFIEKVDEILKTKKADITADTSTTESEIDHMVYELYDLTEDEIKTVEESVK